jgi:type I restriction enzyme M protein
MAKSKDEITLLSILKDSQYNLSIFTSEEITTLEKKIIDKKGKPYVECIIREKEIQLKPEEAVRQLYTSKLINYYGYPKKRIRFEHPVQFGRQTKSSDIVVFDKDRPTVEYIIVEVKKPKLKFNKDQKLCFLIII